MLETCYFPTKIVIVAAEYWCRMDQKLASVNVLVGTELGTWYGPKVGTEWGPEYLVFDDVTTAILFWKNKMCAMIGKTDKLVQDRRKGGYELIPSETKITEEEETSLASHSLSHKVTVTWHRKLGHMCEQGMKIHVERKLLPGLVKLVVTISTIEVEYVASDEASKEAHSSSASGHLEVSELAACLEKASLSYTPGHVKVFWNPLLICHL
ncbi:hypothetical protein Tco_1569880 [Tanacetum coccineum]